MEVSVIETYKSLGFAFEVFLDKVFSNVDYDTIQEVKIVPQKKAVPFPSDKIKIFTKEKIIFIDYLYMYMLLPDVKMGNITAHEQLDRAFSSTDVSEVIKWFEIILNNKNYFDTIRGDNKEDISLKFFNVPNEKKLSEITSDFRDLLISVKGTPIVRAKEIIAYPLWIDWECNGCGTPKRQIILNREKPKKFSKPCMTLINDEKDPDGKNSFICKSMSFQQVGVTKYLNVFNMQIEALPEETPNKLEPRTFHLEFTDKMVQESLIDAITLGSAYKFSGIIKMREIVTDNKIKYLTYLEVMSFEEIDVKRAKIIITEEERAEIKTFLAQPNAIDLLTDRFGKGVVGFLREKKMFLLMKIMLERFNTNKKSNPQDYIMHLLVVGNYARGKSELAGIFQMICDNPYYIIGSSTTGVGLTGATIKDELTGSYGIQAGVLARASNDVLVCEEFDKQQNKAEFGVLNEALSKFEYTVTKAGQYRKFKSNTCVIIIANPEKKVFDETMSLLPQINISGDLLSRFSAISCIISSKDIEEELKINEIMLKKLGSELREQDEISAEYIKKCIKIASEQEPKMDVPEVQMYIDDFTKQVYSLSKQTYGSDAEFYKQVSPRNRMTLLKVVKAVAMFHLHPIPTKEDMKEAYDLVAKFWSEFVEKPNLFNMTEIEAGMSLEQIDEQVRQKLADSKWEVVVDDKKDTKKGKRDLILEKIDKMVEASPEKLCDITELQLWCNQTLMMEDREFEKFLQDLLFIREIFEPKRGFVRSM